jgi:hypothetical protein
LCNLKKAMLLPVLLAFNPR